LFEPGQRLFLLPEPGADGGDVVRRDVSSPGDLLQFREYFLRLGALTRRGISVSERRQNLWVVIQSVCLARFGDGFTKPALLFISPAEQHVRPVRLRLYPNRSSVLFNGLLRLAREIKRQSQLPQAPVVKRVSFHCPFPLCLSFIKAAHRDQVIAIELM